jgi:hypothetical protein
MAHPNCKCPQRIFCDTWRGCQPGEYHCTAYAYLPTGLSLIFVWQVLSPAKVIFAAVGALLLVCFLFLSLEVATPHCDAQVPQAVQDVRAHQDMLIELFSRIEYFFKRLETYMGVPATDAMRSIILDIIVQVISFLAIATKEIKRGGTSESGLYIYTILP